MLFREMALSGISPPPELRDGKTLGWWDWQRGTSIDTSNYVSSWADRLNGLALVQASAGAQPLKGEGIVFDGTSDSIVKAGLSISQPITCYVVCNQISFNSTDAIISFNDASIVSYYQTTTVGSTRLNATTTITNDKSVIGIKQLHTVILNTTSSSIQINNTVAVSGDIGTRTINSIILGTGYSPLLNGNIGFYDVIIRTQLDSE